VSDAGIRRILDSPVWVKPTTTLRRFADRVRGSLIPAIVHPGTAALDAARRFVKSEQKLGHFYDPDDGETIQFLGLFIKWEREGLGVTEGDGVALNTFLTALGMYCAPWPDGDVHRVDRQRRVVLECAEVMLGAASPIQTRAKTDVDNEHSDIDSAAIRLLRVFANNLADKRLERAIGVLTNDSLTVNEMLTQIDGLLPFPPTASSLALGRMFGVKPQAVRKTPWWIENRKGRKAREIADRLNVHQARAKQGDRERPTDKEE